MVQLYRSILCITGLLLLCAAIATTAEKEMLLESGLPNYQLVPYGWDIEHIRQEVLNVNPSESLEAEFFLPWPVGTPPDRDNRVELLRLALRRISGMQGLKYPPSSGKAGEILYQEAHLIASPENPHPLPDPQPHEIKDEMNMYVRTVNDEDTEVIMKIRAVQKDRIRLHLENHTPLRFLFMTIVDTAELGFLFDLSVEDDGVRVYGVGAINTFRIGLLRRAVRRRLTETTEAIVMWIADSIERELMEWK